MLRRHLRLSAFLAAIFMSTGLIYFFLHDSLAEVENFDAFRTIFGFGQRPSSVSAASKHELPPTYPPFGAVVLASGADTDLRWTKVIEHNWTVYEYDIRRPNHENPRLRFPASKGHEAMIYLSYIIDNYDSLPWAAIFMHGHDKAWHQEAGAAQMIRGLNLTALSHQSYISLRCDWYPSCPAEMRPIHHDAIVWGPEANTKGTEAAIAGNWRLLFPDESLPETIASPCCAQFAVTRRAVLGRPKQDYERLRDWLVSSLLEDELSGRVLEKLWAYIFTGESVHCPHPQQCACEWFGRCIGNNFTKVPDELESWENWP